MIRRLIDKLAHRLGYVPEAYMVAELDECGQQRRQAENHLESSLDNARRLSEDIDRLREYIAHKLARFDWREDSGLDYNLAVHVDVMRLIRKVDPMGRPDYYKDDAGYEIYQLALGVMKRIDRDINALVRLGPHSIKSVEDAITREIRNDEFLRGCFDDDDNPVG